MPQSDAERQDAKSAPPAKVESLETISDASVARSKIGLNYLYDYPVLELYRLIVDGDTHKAEKGWLEYAKRGPGNIRGVLNAFAVATQQINKPLTVQLIKDIHFACCTGIPGDFTNVSTTPGVFHTNPKGMQQKFHRRYYSAQGLKELFDYMESNPEYKNHQTPKLCIPAQIERRIRH